jgi:outer membrane lipoprotein SlyB
MSSSTTPIRASLFTPRKLRVDGLWVSGGVQTGNEYTLAQVLSERLWPFLRLKSFVSTSKIVDVEKGMAAGFITGGVAGALAGDGVGAAPGAVAGSIVGAVGGALDFLNI